MDPEKNPELYEELEDREDVEFFFGPGSHGIPSMTWVERISDSP
jgi:hypothetical protein